LQRFKGLPAQEREMWMPGVKVTEAGNPRDYDAAKKVTGRKGHMVVDTQGLLLCGSAQILIA